MLSAMSDPMKGGACMSNWRSYYEETLYPLQDGALICAKNSGTRFFLTGGTALSRGYFKHRYSDDLDLFLSNDSEFHGQSERLLSALIDGGFQIDSTNMIRSPDYVSFYLKQVTDENFKLKIDLANDTAPQFSAPVETPVYFRTDHWENILSNKLCALLRLEPKDVADIWIISKKMTFNWGHALDQAREKELGLDPIILSEVLRGMPEHEFVKIRWTVAPEWVNFRKDIELIVYALLSGADNNPDF